MALDLAKRSASLVVSDINVAAAEETAELVRQQGATAEAVQCDVTDREAVFDLIDETEKRLGGIDFIANNAGVA
ncbi:MAG: SDR family oxidoreductase, partial [Deltaproteobacteria bacterium]|nr:SDR family oxidoreductase [Deltaproteobacteria bacterium]